MRIVDVVDGQIALTPGVWRQDERWLIRLEQSGLQAVLAGDRVLYDGERPQRLYRQGRVEVR